MTAWVFNNACWYAVQIWEDKRESKRIILKSKMFAVIMGADAKKMFADDESEATGDDDEDVV